MYFIAVKKTRQLPVREGGIICYINKMLFERDTFSVKTGV